MTSQLCYASILHFRENLHSYDIYQPKYGQNYILNYMQLIDLYTNFTGDIRARVFLHSIYQSHLAHFAISPAHKQDAIGLILL